MTPARTIRQIKPSSVRDHAPSTMLRITLLLNNEERVFTVNPKKMPLIFLEALDELTQDKSWRNMRVGIQALLKLTDAESMELDTEHIIQISEAVANVTAIPND